MTSETTENSIEPPQLTHEQKQLALAIYHGKPVTELPKDLYIPPDALEVILEAFEGPLDLLLYLIKKHNLDILDIPIAEITRQYVEYINLMQNLRLELAAEYLLMAAMLAEIKSRMLLPRPVNDDEEDELDPRMELIRRLQEYERIKKAAGDLDQMPRLWRDIFPASAEPPVLSEVDKPQPTIELRDLVMAFKDVMARVQINAKHHIEREVLTIRERMTQVLERVNCDRFTEFTQLFSVEEGRLGVVVTFIAVLELLKQSMIELAQAEPYSPIHIKAIE